MTPTQSIWVSDADGWVSYGTGATTATTSVFYYPFVFENAGTASTVPVWSNLTGSEATTAGGHWWLDVGRSVYLRRHLVEAPQPQIWTPAAPAIIGRHARERMLRRQREARLAEAARRDHQALHVPPREIRQPATNARERAYELLWGYLDHQQRRTLRRYGWFIVTGGMTGRKYRIAANDNLIANIYVLENERIAHRLCAHAAHDAMPLHDHLLAQKLMLENCETDFLKIANRHAA